MTIESEAPDNRSLRTIVAVSDDALRPQLLDALLVDDSNDDVIVLESIPRACSRIRELRPDLVILFMDIEDANACQLLSMLEVDRAFRSIRVMASVTEPESSCRARAARSGGAGCGCSTAQALC
jgi:CheY-like chemotaxis protein